MRSSGGEYYVGLDHVRAMAAFAVFAWHFIHIHGGQLLQPLAFPLSIFTEGHTGVALFMTLSGYIFAKLLDGRDIYFGKFIWNRIIRLAPLLIIVIGANGAWILLFGGDVVAYARRITAGFLLPTWPNGGWSIAVELHFYLVLPFLLALVRKSRFCLIGVLLVAISFRAIWYYQTGQVQSLAYWTIVGRIDQFTLGILGFHFGHLLRGRHGFAVSILLSFLVFYWFFDRAGGFYTMTTYPSPSALWVVMTTIEGSAYGMLISWYDTSFRFSGKHPVSKLWASVGAYSYSIYLLHFWIVFRVANFINNHILDLSNPYIALLVAPLAFMLMIPLGYLSFNFIETPFLRYRTRYLKPRRLG